MRNQKKRSLGEEKYWKRDAVEGGFGDVAEECAHENSSDKFRKPEEESDGGGGESGRVAGRETGYPSAEGVFVSEIEQHGSGKEREQRQRERQQRRQGGRGLSLPGSGEIA